MTESANITSVEAVAQFEAVLRVQSDRAREVMETYRRELQRVVGWFENELPLAWKTELRHRYEKMSKARTEYETCRLRTVAGQRPGCFEEKKQYDRARRRLQDAERKIEEVKAWRIRYAEEVEECRGRLGKFQSILDHDLEKSLALLERTIESLEKYLGHSVSSLPTDPSHTNQGKGA